MDTNSSAHARRFTVTGLHCAACAARAERTLKQLDGVTDAAVNFATAEATVAFDEAVVSPEQLRDALRKAGYDLVVEDAAAGEERRRDRYQSLCRRVVVSAVCTLVAIALSFGPFAETNAGRAGLWVLATVVVFGAGAEFFTGAWRQALHRTANMDTLVALSTGIAYLFSLFNAVYPTFWTSRGMEAHVYYDSVCGVITFILIGRLLEERAKRSTASALRDLAGLRPARTLVVLPDGTTAERSIAAVQPGDVLVVRPGERVAVDGVVTEGESYVDESMMSGEPIPVHKAAGANVYAGTTNQKGSFRFRAEKVGDATMLAHIIELVRDAQNSKAPVQRLVDRVAAVFVPVVIGLAVLTFLLWTFLDSSDGLTRGLQAAVTVLVIACPCALGLATPTALMVGMGRAAQRGILVRDAESLETACRVDTVVLDKTGTLTEGRPAVTAMKWITGEADKAPVLRALEERSAHPLAGAVVRWLDGRGVIQSAEGLTAFEDQAGLGVAARCEGHVYRAGNVRFMRENGVSEAVLTDVASQAEGAGTLVCFAEDDRLLAIAHVADRLKASSPRAVAELRREGIEVHLLTGDNEQAAQAAAQAAGIAHCRGGVLPDGKAAYVDELRRQGRRVAMVGDGVNDSAALAHADLSIAMGQGSDVAMDVAQMTIVRSDLALIAEAIALSRRTVRVVRENLFWAFIYNVLAIPIAAGALYPVWGYQIDPMVAGAAMALSSVSVVTNSLRLKR